MSIVGRLLKPTLAERRLGVWIVLGLLLSAAGQQYGFGRCGEYSAHSVTFRNAPYLADSLSFSGTVEGTLGDTSPVPVQVPCSGPECRRNLPVAPEKAPLRLPETDRGWALASQAARLFRTAGWKWPTEDHGSTGYQWVYRLERPPCS